jgi:hypothetical protein
MLSNTASLPPKPINNIAESRPVIQPTLRMSIQRLHGREVLIIPDRRENVPRGIETVLRGGIVILFTEDRQN